LSQAITVVAVCQTIAVVVSPIIADLPAFAITVLIFAIRRPVSIIVEFIHTIFRTIHAICTTVDGGVAFGT